MHHVHDDPRAQGLGSVWLVGDTVETLTTEAVDPEIPCLFVRVAASPVAITDLTGRMPER